jgi:hypothetical protein
VINTMWPIRQGTLFFAGHTSHEDAQVAQQLYTPRLERFFDEAPIKFRSKAGRAYPYKHVLSANVAEGFSVHLIARYKGR